MGTRTIIIIQLHLSFQILVPALIQWRPRTKNWRVPARYRTLMPNLTSIADCTEFKTERPGNPAAQRRLWSSYKSTNTFKLLVSINPWGAFNFVSNLFSGNSSDKFCTKQSGYLSHVKPNDASLWDRGFNVQDEIAKKKGKCFAPPSVRKCKYGKKVRLNRKEVKKTAILARLRIPVEIAIGRIKRFKLLANKIKLKSYDLINKTVQVAAALCNLWPNIVS